MERKFVSMEKQTARKMFPEELQELIKKRDDIDTQIKEQNELLGTVMDQGETRHDNPGFDEVQRRLHTLGIQFQELSSIISSAQIMTREVFGQGEGNVVKMGSKVKITNGTKEMTYEIGGITGLGKMSYDAPLAKAILGKKAGEVVTFSVGSNKMEITIIEIL